MLLCIFKTLPPFIFYLFFYFFDEREICNSSQDLLIFLLLILDFFMELNLRIELKLNKIVQIQSTILKVMLTFFYALHFVRELVFCVLVYFNRFFFLISYSRLPNSLQHSIDSIL